MKRRYPNNVLRNNNFDGENVEFYEGDTRYTESDAKTEQEWKMVSDLSLCTCKREESSWAWLDTYTFGVRDPECEQNMSR